MKHAHLPLTSLKVLFLLSILVSSASYAQAAGALSATFRDEGRPFTLKDGVAYVDDQNGKTVIPYCRPARGALRKAQDSAARQGRTPTCPKKSKLTFVDAETKEPVAADRGVSEFSRIFISLAPRVVGRTTDADKEQTAGSHSREVERWVRDLFVCRGGESQVPCRYQLGAAWRSREGEASAGQRERCDRGISGPASGGTDECGADD